MIFSTFVVENLGHLSGVTARRRLSLSPISPQKCVFLAVLCGPGLCLPAHTAVHTGWHGPRRAAWKQAGLNMPGSSSLLHLLSTHRSVALTSVTVSVGHPVWPLRGFAQDFTQSGKLMNEAPVTLILASKGGVCTAPQQKYMACGPGAPACPGYCPGHGQ